MSTFDIICSMSFDIGVQSYSNINSVINFHIDMTQPDKTKVVPDKLLIDEVNKQLNITTNSPVTLLNQYVPSV